jgi:hypothetical protein
MLSSSKEAKDAAAAFILPKKPFVSVSGTRHWSRPEERQRRPRDEPSCQPLSSDDDNDKDPGGDDHEVRSSSPQV